MKVLRHNMLRMKKSLLLLVIIAITISLVPIVISSTVAQAADHFHNTVDNGDGTLTFTQTVDEYSTSPHYSKPSSGGFQLYSGRTQDFGWMHDFPDYNQPGLQIQSVTLTIRAYDVDSETKWGYNGEYDGISGDGSLLNPQYLQGTNNTWSVTNFDVDPGALSDDKLDVWCDIDMHNTGMWTTMLDYSVLTIMYSITSNNPPYSPTLQISPVGSTSVNDNLVVTVTGPNPADPDGDSVTYRYRWLVDVGTGNYIDDEFAGRGDHTGNTVPPADTRNGDKWKVEVTPVDEYGMTGSKNTVSFTTIGGNNAPPIANAGGNQTVVLNQQCALDGSDSYDPGGTNPQNYGITGYKWELYSGGSWTTIGTSAMIPYTFTAEGTYTVSLTVTDNEGAVDDDLAYITVEAIQNQPPVATSDSYSTNEDTVLTVTAPSVLGNDTDADGNPLIASLITAPAKGTLVLNSDSSFTYTPAANVNGTDSFTYKASDGLLDSGVATVTITINPVNDAPIAHDQSVSTREDKSVAITLTATDPDGDPIPHWWPWTPPAHGEVTYAAVGPNWTYTPAPGYSGPDSFVFKVADPSGAQGMATVTIDVIANRAPIAVNQSVTTIEDTPLAITLQATDPDGDPIPNWWPWISPAHGMITYATVGPNWTYTPNPNYYGPDSFVFKVADTYEDQGMATVTITVTPVNDSPVANAGGPYSGTEGSAVSFNGGGSKDSDGDVLTYDWIFGDGDSATGVAPSHIYADNGTYTITHTVTDPSGESSTASATVMVNNVAPVVNVGPDATMDEGHSFTSIGTGGLAHLWKFDEMSGLTAYDSGDSINGLIGAGATWVPGRIGNGAIRLNGTANSYVDFGSTVDQFGTNNFTVNFWINTTEASTYFDLLGDRWEGSHGNFLQFRMRENGVIVVEIDEDGAGTNYIGLESVGLGYNDGQWHHVAAVRSANTMKLYVDGVMEASGTSSGIANLNDASPFKLGQSYGGYLPLNGSFDDIRIYNSVLSGDDMQAMANGLPLPGSFTDPGSDTWTATVDYGDCSGEQPLSLNADKTLRVLPK